jgi:threonine aldolase
MILEFRKHFASDNNSGVIPEVMKALNDVNQGHFPSYGEDPITYYANQEVCRVFGECESYFVFNGTAANVLALQVLLKPYQSIITAATAHIQESECGAPERFLGSKLQLCGTEDGKITVAQIKEKMIRMGDQHASQPKVISITQPTEYGTVYTIDELKEISAFAKKNNLYVHIDGSRLVNAATFLKVEPYEITKYADIVSLGGTKNGLLGAEAVLIFNEALQDDFKFIRKQGMQLAGKMRFLSAQIHAWLKNDVYKQYSKQACGMAKLLAEKLSEVDGVTITQQVETNAVFVKMPRAAIKAVREKYFFYVWDEHTFECRLMTSFDTKEEDVLDFVKHVADAVK